MDTAGIMRTDHTLGKTLCDDLKGKTSVWQDIQKEEEWWGVKKIKKRD